MCVTAMPSEATGSNVLINQQIIFDRDVWLDSLSINVWGTAAHHLLAIVVRGPHHRSAMTANSVDDGSAADGSSAFAYALPFTGFAKGSGAFVAKDHSLIFQVSAKMWGDTWVPAALPSAWRCLCLGRLQAVTDQVHYVRQLDRAETSSFRFTLAAGPPAFSTWLTTYKLTSGSGRHIGEALAAAAAAHASKLLRASAVASPSADPALVAGCRRDMAALEIDDIVLHTHARGVSVGVRLEREDAHTIDFQVTLWPCTQSTLDAPPAIRDRRALSRGPVGRAACRPFTAPLRRRSPRTRSAAGAVPTRTFSASRTPRAARSRWVASRCSSSVACMTRRRWHRGSTWPLPWGKIFGARCAKLCAALSRFLRF